jgi:HK97 family phage major capsid protein
MSDGQQINPVEVLTKSIAGIEKSLASNSEAISKMVEMQTSQAEIKKSKEESDAEIKKAVEEVEAKLTKSYNEKLQEHDLKFEEIEKSSRKQGKMSGEENTSILEKAEVKDAIAKSISGEKAQIDCDVFKSLVSYNNTSVGALQREMRNLGEVDINLQTSSPVVNLVNIVTSSSIKGVVYDTIDTSVLPPQEVLEGMSIEQKKDIIKRGQIDIQPEKVKAWNYITDTVIHGIRAGEYRSNPIDAELRALDVQLSKQIARKILNGKVVSGKGIQGILPKALTFPSNQVVPTQTANTLSLTDVSLLVSRLKSEYLRGAVCLIDRQALQEIYNEPASDGHLKIEYFDYTNGIARIRTADGTFPLIGVQSFPASVPASQHDGFAGYKSFPSGAGDINEGYIIGGTNTGKAYAVFANFRDAYTLTRTTTREVGLDDSFKDRLVDGLNVYGMIDYIGGNIIRQEGIVVGYIS